MSCALFIHIFIDIVIFTFLFVRYILSVHSWSALRCKLLLSVTIININKFVQQRWPYDMRPSARAEKYIRDAGP